jgi:hypothetical protein
MLDRLFGPLFALELIRITRGPWLLRMRCYTALILGLTGLAIFAAWA